MIVSTSEITSRDAASLEFAAAAADSAGEMGKLPGLKRVERRELKLRAGEGLQKMLESRYASHGFMDYLTGGSALNDGIWALLVPWQFIV